MFYFVYILRSNSNELYVGQTSNLLHRISQQENKNIKAAKFVKDGEEFRLEYYEKYPSRIDAIRRERQIKGWTRAKKEALIDGNIKLLKRLSKMKS